MSEERKCDKTCWLFEDCSKEKGFKEGDVCLDYQPKPLKSCDTCIHGGCAKHQDRLIGSKCCCPLWEAIVDKPTPDKTCENCEYELIKNTDIKTYCNTKCPHNKPEGGEYEAKKKEIIIRGEKNLKPDDEVVGIDEVEELAELSLAEGRSQAIKEIEGKVWQIPLWAYEYGDEIRIHRSELLAIIAEAKKEGE